MKLRSCGSKFLLEYRINAPWFFFKCKFYDLMNNSSDNRSHPKLTLCVWCLLCVCMHAHVCVWCVHVDVWCVCVCVVYVCMYMYNAGHSHVHHG